VEEPEYTLAPGEKPELKLEQPQENITVARFIVPKNLGRGPEFEQISLELTNEAIQAVNTGGEFDSPLLWFYNPMDASWAVYNFNRRGVVYDCMDELSQFKFAPQNLIDNEKLLLAQADIVFTGGYELWTKKAKQHPNTHFFGCGVEYDHFANARDKDTKLPEDVKDIQHPILGWFGVIDERMDYDLIATAAKAKPDWNFVMVGPVVKVDPN